MSTVRYLNVLVGASATLLVGSQLMPGTDQSGPVLNAAVAFVSPAPSTTDSSRAPSKASAIASVTKAALEAFTGAVRPLSRPEALQDAFRSYFAYKAAHPDEVRKPYFYFVDYGLPSTTPRGYVFDMSSLKVVDGPFAVAHGRGSSASKYGIPTRFSNRLGSAATSLGLYLTAATYAFRGSASGHSYRSIGMRLLGVSRGFNDNAFVRRVVAHGAPYVTENTAGRSEGCPAMEPSRAKRLLPELSDGGMVFLFAPDPKWMNQDPWVAAGN